MQKILNLSAIAALAVLPLAATAGAPPAEEGLSYNYLEAGYVFGDDINVEGPGGKIDIDSGWTFGASAELASNVYVYGNSISLDLDAGGGTNASLDTQSLGVGYHFPILADSSPLDVYATLSYERADVLGLASDGYGAHAGIRWMPIQGFELNAWGGWRDYGELAGNGGIDLDGWVYGAGALYHVTQNLALTGSWQHYEMTLDPDGGGSKTDVDVDGFVAGVRWNY